MKVAICEDSKYDLIEIKNAINVYCKQTNHICSIFEFNCGEELIKTYKKGLFDIILLDIFMKNLNGIETAENIRKIDNNCCIVFITCSTDYSLDAFRVEALDYLVKPISLSNISRCLSRYIRLYGDSDKYIEIKEDGISKNISSNHIFYIEVCSNYCYVHTDKKVYKQITALTTLSSQTNKIPQFARCHKGYIWINY